MHRITSPSATVIAAATGVLLLQVFVASQGRRAGNPDVEEINNRQVAAGEALVKMRSPIQGAIAAQLTRAVDAESVERVGRGRLLRIRSRSLNASGLIAALSR